MTENYNKVCLFEIKDVYLHMQENDFLKYQEKQKQVFDFLIEYSSGIYGNAGLKITVKMVNVFMIKVTKNLIDEIETYFSFKEEMLLDKQGSDEIEGIIERLLDLNNKY